MVRFVVLNAISSMIWAILFSSIGYVFGLGAEQIVGKALARHEKLLIGLAIGLTVAVIAWLIARHVSRKERDKEVRETAAS